MAQPQKPRTVISAVAYWLYKPALPSGEGPKELRIMDWGTRFSAYIGFLVYYLKSRSSSCLSEVQWKNELTNRMKRVLQTISFPQSVHSTPLSQEY